MRKFLTSMLLATIGLTALGANRLPQDPDVRIGTLPNGLTYYLRHNAWPEKRADFYLAQTVGSVNEEESQRGLAHFLEHMCFNGTKHFPDNSLITYLESLGVKFGANLNAYTSTDETVYNICDVPTARISALDSCLLILRDWSHDLTLADEAIDAERGVIKGEWRQRQGSPANRMLEKAAPEIFGGSIYGERLPIGLMDVVENFKPDELRDYYHRWYHPQNQCVIVVGDIDVDRTEAQIRALWSDIDRPAHDATPAQITIPSNKNVIASVQTDPEQTTPMIQLYIKHPGIASDKANTIEEMRREMTSDLVTEMLVQRFDPIENAANSPLSNLGIGDRKFLLTRAQDALMLRANTTSGREADAITTLAAELKRAAIHGFTPSEVKRAKLAVRASLDNEFANRARITNTQYARRYVRHFLDGGALPSVEQYYKMMKGVINQVDTAETREFIASVINPADSNVVIVAYLPQSDIPTTDADNLAAAYTGVDTSALLPFTDTEDNSPILATSPVAGSIVAETELPQFGSKIWTLSNGIRVHLRHSDSNPDQILVQGYSPGGISQHYDPALAADYRIANDAIAVSGTGNFTSSTLRRRLVGRKAAVVATVENMEERIGVSTTPADLETALQVLYLKATDLRADTTAYKAMVENKRAKLSSQRTNPTFAMGDSIHYHVYSRHPLGAKLNAADLDAADYSRILALYADRFADMSDFTFYITGNFNEDSLRTAVCTYIASLPGGGRIEKPRDIQYRYTPESARLRFTTPMATPQTIAYTFFHAPCSYTLPDIVAAHTLGSILQSHLRQDLREKRGWTYGVKGHCGLSAGMNGDDPARVIMPVYIRVAPENADATFAAVSDALTALSSPDAITPDELRSVTGYMQKQYEQNMTDNVYWLTVMHMYDKFGRDMHNGYTQALRELTPERVARFAAAHFGPGVTCLQLEMSPAE